MATEGKDITAECPDCGGEGILDGEPCAMCDGTGEVSKQMSEGKTVPYFKRLHALLKEKVKDWMPESDFMEMTKQARAHAGGVARAAKRKEAMMSEDGYRMFIELEKYAEPPEWIPYLPKPGEFNHSEYGKIKITKDRNQRFIDNFAAAVYQSKLPINAEHKPDVEGAYGWITGMRLNADESVDARVDWTDLGDRAIRNDRFKFISPEWFDKWEKKSTGEVIKDVASGAALTVRPFFKEDSLRAMVANEHGMFEISDKRPAAFTRVFNDRDSKFYFTALEPVQSQEAIEMADKPDEKAQAVKGMSDDEAKRFTELEKQFTDYKADSEKKMKELADTAAAKDTDLKAASERVVTLEKDARTRRFNEAIKDFTGKSEDHLKFMESLADKFGEDSETFKQYVEREKVVATQLRASAGFAEIGSDAGGSVDQSPEAQLEAATQKIMSEDKTLTHAKAYSIACDRNPKIYNEHREATRQVAH
jgi:phage I-like protein